MSENDSEEGTLLFATSDLDLASYLHALGFALYHVDRTNPKRVCFLFHSRNNGDNIDTYVDKWQIGDCIINGKVILNSQHILKRRIWDDAGAVPSVRKL